jgi:hypothetical protein
VVTWKVNFVVWIVMGRIGGADPASLNPMLFTPSIDLSSGKTGHSKTLH